MPEPWPQTVPDPADPLGLASLPAPERIQLKRTRGWRLPPGARSVARPGKYGNPFGLLREIGRDDPLRPYLDMALEDMSGGSLDLSRDHYDTVAPHLPSVAVAAFRYWLRDQPGLVEAAKKELRGKPLACWCPVPAGGEPDNCHRAVWIEVANA